MFAFYGKLNAKNVLEPQRESGGRGGHRKSGSTRQLTLAAFFDCESFIVDGNFANYF